MYSSEGAPMMNRFLHYSAKTITSIHSQVQSPDITWHKKPYGLWITVEGDDGWKKWCVDNGFGEDRLAICHEVILSETCNVLWLDSADGIDEFTRRYGRPDRDRQSIRQIDWRKVSEQYQGIVIVPYIWSRRLGAGTDWYYGWDCASGCIWDANAIRYIKVIESEFVAKECEAIDAKA